MTLEKFEEEDVTKTDVKSQNEEEQVHFFYIGYMCEECNYRWKAKRKASLSDEDTTGEDRWTVDDSSINCPMCGSFNITRV